MCVICADRSLILCTHCDGLYEDQIECLNCQLTQSCNHCYGRGYRSTVCLKACQNSEVTLLKGKLICDQCCNIMTSCKKCQHSGLICGLCQNTKICIKNCEYCISGYIKCPNCQIKKPIQQKSIQKKPIQKQIKFVKNKQTTMTVIETLITVKKKKKVNKKKKSNLPCIGHMTQNVDLYAFLIDQQSNISNITTLSVNISKYADIDEHVNNEPPVNLIYYGHKTIPKYYKIKDKKGSCAKFWK